MGISSSFNLLCTFTVVRTFPTMEEKTSKYGTFWLFMVCSLASIVFVYSFLPETKGHTLEEIEKFFSKRFPGSKDSTRSEKDDSSEKSDVYIIENSNNSAYDGRHLKQVDVESLNKSQDESDDDDEQDDD